MWNDLSENDVIYPSDGIPWVPEGVAAGDAMTLLKANATLKDISASAATTTAYEFTTKGVTVNGEITGSAAAKNGAVDFTVTANQATNLTFGEVDWMASGAWIDHATTLTNISFDGADVDTAKISFTNVNKLDDGAKMTLVSAFGTKAGIITGSAYTLGDLSGEGHAYFENNDLLYLVTKGVGGDTPEPKPKDVSDQTETVEEGTTVTEDVTAAAAEGNETATSNKAEVKGTVGTEKPEEIAQIKEAHAKQQEK